MSILKASLSTLVFIIYCGSANALDWHSYWQNCNGVITGGTIQVCSSSEDARKLQCKLRGGTLEDEKHKCGSGLNCNGCGSN
jgi:hypothetical protein